MGGIASSLSPSQRVIDRGMKFIILLAGLMLLVYCMVVPNLGCGSSGASPATYAVIAVYETALHQYARDHHGNFPTGSSEEVATLLMTPVAAVKSERPLPYLEKLPKDVWGQLLRYEWPNRKNPKAKRPAIWSNGMNRQNEDGAGDDLTN